MKDQFYSQRKRWYKRVYPTLGDRLFAYNGFSAYPQNVYDYFLPHIILGEYTKEIRLIDFCCGNGLLLKHLMLNSLANVIPYGVDFMTKSIDYAKSILHVKHKQNFHCTNAVHFTFNNAPYNIALIDPCHFPNNDFAIFLGKVINSTTNKIIFYCYSDVLNALNLSSVQDLHGLRHFNLKSVIYPEISIAVLDIKRI